MIKKLWIDLETTGLLPENSTIIEIAAVHDESVFHEYCLPSEKPDNFLEIEEITGITWEFLQKNGKPESVVYNNFIMFLNSLVDKYDKKDKLVFSGYNPTFDSNFIRYLFEKYNNSYYGSYFFSINYDVMTLLAEEICKGLLPFLKNYKLKTVCENYGIEFNAHSAIEDIQATIELYNLITRGVDNGQAIKRFGKALQD